MVQDFFDKTFWGNSVTIYLTAFVIFIICFAIIKVFKKIVLTKLKKWAEKTKTTLDDFLIKEIEKTIIPLLYYGGFYLALTTLTLNPRIESIFNKVSVILVTFFFLRVITSTINYAINIFFKKKGHDESKRKELKGITTILSFLIWTIGFVFLLDNLGFNISAVIAGLGIGGIAIALAAQTILGDLFSYFIIFFDRPFEIGDFITVGDKSGTVEFIGIKTTRLRAIGGEQLIFANKDLTNSRIHNYKKMEKRRVVFTLGVIYQTTAAQLAEIPAIVKNIIQSQADTIFDRGNFASFGDSSLNFEFVYYVNSPDYSKYMNIQENINLKIFEEFEKRKIEFAYPTQTIFVEKNSGKD